MELLLLLGVGVDGDRVQGGHDEAADVAAAVNSDGAGAGGGLVGIVAPSQHVAVGARRQSCVQRAGLPRVVRVAVEGDERVAVAREGDLVGRASRPVRDVAGASCVAPCYHVADLRPAVLTDPVLAVGAVAASLHAHRGGSGVGVGEVVGGHDPHVGVGPGQHEQVGEVVQGAVLVGQLGAPIALSVVADIIEYTTVYTQGEQASRLYSLEQQQILLVEEGHGVLVWHEAPRFSEVLQICHLVLADDVGVQVVGVVELGHLPCSKTVNQGTVN